MTYLMVDISGRSPVYDIPLCEALHKELPQEHNLRLLAPNINPKDVDFDYNRLFNILPHRLRYNDHHTLYFGKYGIYFLQLLSDML